MHIGGYMCTRSVLILLNAFLVVGGVLLLVVGIYSKMSVLNVDIDFVFSLTVNGAFLLCAAVFGLFATFNQSQVMLGLYIFFMSFVMFLQLWSGLGSILLSTDELSRFVQKRWTHMDIVTKNRIQMGYVCCGRDRYSYADPLGDPPCSSIIGKLCCDELEIIDNCTCYPCKSKLLTVLEFIVKLHGGIALLFAFPGIFAIFVAADYIKYLNLNDEIGAFL